MYTTEQQAVIDEVKAQIREDIEERGIPFMERLHREHGPQDKQGMAWWEFVDTEKLDIQSMQECVVGQYTVSVLDGWQPYVWSPYMWSPYMYGSELGGLRNWEERQNHGLSWRFSLRDKLDVLLIEYGETNDILGSLYNDAWREAIQKLRRSAYR